MDAALGATAAGRTGGGGSSVRGKETKEEWAELGQMGRIAWAGWVNQKGRSLVGPARYGERKRGGLRRGLGRKRFWAALRKRKRFSDFDSRNNIQI
jgi:hypothetical protein